MLCTIAAVAYGLLLSAVAIPLEWGRDSQFLSVTDGHCDFPVYDPSSAGTDQSFQPTVPYIIRNVTNGWPAYETWQKGSLLAAYGSRVVRSGSESSIVHSGGVAENESTLADMIESMHRSIQGLDESAFIFDTTILRVIPELNQDFTVPAIFHAWDNWANESTAAMWHMLSLGPSRSGLPFHNHGRTWLAVVHGIKQWFLYPPGYDPPQSIDAAYSPMQPVSKWVSEIYPQLRQYPKPPLQPPAEGLAAEDFAEGYRPLECRQYPGEMLFIPSRWTHLTLNIGETIAIGGQESLVDEERMAGALSVLKRTTRNFDAWKDLALAQFNTASRKLRGLRQRSGAQFPGEIIFFDSVTELDTFLSETGDSWVVLYFDQGMLDSDSDAKTEFSALQSTWRVLAQNLTEVANVAVVDLEGRFTTEPSLATRLELDRLDVQRDPSVIRWSEVDDAVMYVVDADHHYIELPCAKFHRGAGAGQGRADFTSDTKGLTFGGALDDAEAIAGIVRQQMSKKSLAPGSITSTPVFLRQEYAEALSSFRRALEIKPLQPELRNMMGDVAGLARDWAAMDEVLQGNMAIVDNLAREGLAPLSLASMYHKIGHNYIKVRKGREAVVPMQKALRAVPTFRPALIDLAFAYALLGDRYAAEYWVEQLRLVSRKELDDDVERLESQVAALEG